MKSKRTFDRQYDLTEELPDGLYLPCGFGFVQLYGAGPYENILTRIHVLRQGLQGFASLDADVLCRGKLRATPWRVLGLSGGVEYTFCLKCQRAAKAIEEGGGA
jgi:hypothetical protein